MAGSVRFQYPGHYRNYDPRSRNQYDYGTVGPYYGTHPDDRDFESDGKQRPERSENISLQRYVLDCRWPLLGKFDRGWPVVAPEIRQDLSIEPQHLLRK